MSVSILPTYKFSDLDKNKNGKLDPEEILAIKNDFVAKATKIVDGFDAKAKDGKIGNGHLNWWNAETDEMAAMEKAGIKYEYYKTVQKVKTQAAVSANATLCGRIGGVYCNGKPAVFSDVELNRSYGKGKAYTIDDVVQGLCKNLFDSATGKTAKEIESSLSAVVITN